MKIGVFGGSFNPPHKMHKYIADELLNKQFVDKIVFVPTGSKYKYKNNLVPDKFRYDMLEILSKDNENIFVSDCELKDYVVYTCETLAYFKELYPNDDIYFICGADNLSYIDKWKNGEEILSNYKILVIDRKTNNLSEILEQFKAYRDNIIIVPIELSDISSTKIRELIVNKELKKLTDFLDSDVLDYIVKENLYENI